LEDEEISRNAESELERWIAEAGGKPRCSTTFNERWICLSYNWSDVANVNCRNPRLTRRETTAVRNAAS